MTPNLTSPEPRVVHPVPDEAKTVTGISSLQGMPQLHRSPGMVRVLNETTYLAVSKWLARWNRLALLHKRTAILCFECREMRRVADYFHGATNPCLLECKHRRSLSRRTDTEIAAYESTKIEHEARMQVLGSNNPSKQFVQVFEMDVEEA